MNLAHATTFSARLLSTTELLETIAGHAVRGAWLDTP
jgi:hypothetical protein